MPRATFRFYQELNDFLPPALRKTTITHELTRRASVKDVIESFGVPHTEVELILANGRSVDFSYIVQAGDRISVYPMFEALDISPLIRLRENPLRDPRFIIDANLGRLARYLRLLGFDTLYCNDYPDQEIARIAQQDRRIVLTRDRALLQHKSITHGYFVRSDKPRIKSDRCKYIFSSFQGLPDAWVPTPARMPLVSAGITWYHTAHFNRSEDRPEP